MAETTPERVWLTTGQALDPAECTLSHINTDGHEGVEYISIEAHVAAIEAAAKRLRSMYEPIFAIKSTGDPKHPVRAEIDWDAKAIFDEALEAAAKEQQQ